MIFFIVVAIGVITFISGDRSDGLNEYAEGSGTNALLSKYGLILDLPKEWDGYTVSVGQCDPDSPKYEYFKSIDKNHFIVRISPLQKSETFQELILVGFRLDPWNDYGKGNVDVLPPIVTFSDKFVYSIDPYYYDISKEGYNDVIDILMSLTYYEYNEGDYKTIDTVTVETEQIIYSGSTDVIRLKWRQIMQDDVYTNGRFVIEQYNGQSWQEVHSLYEEDLVYTIDRDSAWISYPTKGLLEKGMYRILIEFKRNTLYGLTLTSPLYRSYDEFEVGDEEIYRNSDVTLEGVGLETEYEIYPEGVIEIHAKWYNNLNDEFMYGAQFSVEEHLDNVWQKVKFPDSDFTFHLVGYPLKVYDEKWQRFYLEIYTDGLKEGNYRIRTSLHRMTLDGKDFGAGNYPSYQIYSDFEVGSKPKERKMVNLHKNFYVYKNDTYNFMMYLPKDWEGLTVVKEEHAIESPIHNLLYALDSGYYLIRIRHPSSDGYQDIVFSVISRERWNKNAPSATNDDLDLLPDNVFSNGVSLFIRDPYHYNKNLEKFDEVNEIIDKYLDNY